MPSAGWQLCASSSARNFFSFWVRALVKAVAFGFVTRARAFPDLLPRAERHELLARHALHQDQVAIAPALRLIKAVGDDIGEVMQHCALRLAQVLARDACIFRRQ